VFTVGGGVVTLLPLSLGLRLNIAHPFNYDPANISIIYDFRELDEGVVALVSGLD
jgi:hypothetical protein